MNESVTGKEADSRPYVICHMLASLDGKIDGSFFAAPESRPAIAEYGNIRQAYGSTTSVSIFEQSDFLPQKGPAAFELKEVKQLEGSGLWLRYLTRK